MIDQARKLRELAHPLVPHGSASSDTSIKPVQNRSSLLPCRSVAITSGKGGVGKSNIAVSLAIALARLNKRVLLFDGDLGLANIHLLLGIAPPYNLSHVVQKQCSLDQTLCKGPENITIIPGASGILSMANIELVQLELLIRQLCELEQTYDFLIIDGGAGIGAVSMQLNCVADSVLLIITPEPTSLADAYATAKVLFTKGVKNIMVLVNMVRSAHDGTETFNTLNKLTASFLHKKVFFAGVLPFDVHVQKCIRAQKNILLDKGSHAFSLKIGTIARKFCGLSSRNDRSFFARLFSNILHVQEQENISLP